MGCADTHNIGAVAFLFKKGDLDNLINGRRLPIP
jgi:hypothetical protein